MLYNIGHLWGLTHFGSQVKGIATFVLALFSAPEVAICYTHRHTDLYEDINHFKVYN